MDLLLTDAFLSITKHLKYGQLNTDSLSRVRADSLAPLVLSRALNEKEIRRILEEQEPHYSKYKLLRHALATMIDTTEESKRKFWLSGNTSDSSEEYNKVVSLEINLERWRTERWLQGRYIAVNIAGYMMDVVEEDSVMLESRIIVGTPKNQTPLLDGLIRSFTIFPYWNVPRNIAVKEILPQLKKDSLYLRNHKYDVLNPAGEVVDGNSIDWTPYHENNFPFTIRQKEGVDNALGLIKFTFNNPYSVYLHDTNARLLFKREKRSLSHGCVRVDKALELGRYLVKDDKVYCSPEDLDQYLEMGKQLTIRIVKPIPVHLRYLTCDVRNGKVEFYKDIYGLDEMMRKQMYSEHVAAEPLIAQNQQ
jgi:L,D-transpeptidase YcbB